MSSPLFIRLGCVLLKAGRGRVKYKGQTKDDWTEAEKCVSRADVRELIRRGLLVKEPVKGISRARANKTLAQRRKGRQKGPGTRSGSAKSQAAQTGSYVSRIRAVRDELKKCRSEGLITSQEYRLHYRRLATPAYNTREKVRTRVINHGPN